MKDITDELERRDCVICMNCGKVYETTGGCLLEMDECPCELGHLNWLNGDFALSFWGSPAAFALAKREQPFSD